MIRTLTRDGLNLIKSFEGIEDGDPTTVNLDPYPDISGYWTIGWGHAIVHSGRMLRGKADKTLAYSLYPGGITKLQAELLLQADVLDTCRDVYAALEHYQDALPDGAYAALVSFAYNNGTGAFRRSTLRRHVLAGDWGAAAREFKKWVYSGGVKRKGLVNRRAAEEMLFRAAIAKVPPYSTNPELLRA